MNPIAFSCFLQEVIWTWEWEERGSREKGTRESEGNLAQCIFCSIIKHGCQLFMRQPSDVAQTHSMPHSPEKLCTQYEHYSNGLYTVTHS